MRLRLNASATGPRGAGPFQGLMAWSTGWAVRRTWPDGTHDLFGFAPRAGLAQRRLRRDMRYWRTGPLRPTGYAIVATGSFDARLHPVGCRQATCFATAEVTR